MLKVLIIFKLLNKGEKEEGNFLFITLLGITSIKC